jgi:hypothetical protein
MNISQVFTRPWTPLMRKTVGNGIIDIQKQNSADNPNTNTIICDILEMFMH